MKGRSAKRKHPLECTVCGRHNYAVLRSRQDAGKLVLKKYCPYCKHHTEHREGR